MRRFAWFDCLRCFAVLLVFVHHGPDIAQRLPDGIARLFTLLKSLGWVGVDLFFVLSGFLVSGLLFDEYDETGSLDIRRFLIRRGFKIIPPFYVLVAVTVVYDLAMHIDISKNALLSDIFFLQNYRPGAWPYAWTLAVEVHFYILLALLLAYLSTRAKANWVRPLPWLLASVIVVTFLLRLIHSQNVVTDINVLRDIQATHLHLDVLTVGVLLRYLYHYHRGALGIFERGRVVWLLLAAVLVLPSAGLHEPHPFYLTALISTFNWMAFFLVVYQATLWPFPTSGLLRWLVWPIDYLGKHSYSIYLWHVPVLVWMADRLMPEPTLLKLAVFIALGCGVGCLLSEILEMPVLHLRNHLFPSVTKAKTISRG